MNFVDDAVEVRQQATITGVAPREIAAEAVADEMDKDVMHNNGPNFVKSKLKDKLIMVPRSGALCTNGIPSAQSGVTQDTKKTRIYRHPPSTLGPFHEVSSDGLEKIGQDALKMGDIGLPIYGWKDKWNTDLLKINVVPNSRTKAAIGHLFLDFVEEYGGTVLQSTMDKGWEVGWLEAIQTVLREQCAPDINLDVYPAHKLIKSVHNTIIEAFWRWLREKLGINLQDNILRGKNEHIFDPNVAFHRFAS
ncbi:hypothetical protein B0H13DRAFT_1882523 [Mycena leptocephala]|nr:hypothetical protein B0H13DRAFT_1882523 [Mycena leptocephala]